MAKKKYYSSGYMIKNDNGKIANMPTEAKTAYYPDNPSYYPSTYIDDSMNGIDRESRDMAKYAGLVKGSVS